MINMGFKAYGNRGMLLEELLNDTNRCYLEKNIAVIYKKPTPIQVVRTSNGKIVEAYFKEPSTTDYNGIYKGKYIDFEAKETTNNTSFPIKNIHPHQIRHMENIINHDGICFLIIYFTTLNKIYYLKAEDFIYFIKNNTKKSIPISYFEEVAYEIKIGLGIKVNYLKIIDNIMEVANG